MLVPNISEFTHLHCQKAITIKILSGINSIECGISIANARLNTLIFADTVSNPYL